MKTHYEILSVSPEADQRAIKAAYRKILKESHPDLHRGDAAAEQRSKQIIDAYAVLRDAHRRARYDRWLQHGRVQRGRLLLITLFVTMGLASGGSLLVLNILLAPETGAPRVAMVGETAFAPARTQTEPSQQSLPGRDAETALVPGGFLPPIPLWADWMLAENTADPMEIAAFVRLHAGTPEAGFAEHRLAQWIGAAEDRGRLEALGRIVSEPLAERVRGRLAQLKAAEDLITAALPDATRASPGAADAAPMMPAPANRKASRESAPHDSLNRAIALLNKTIINDPRNPQPYMHRAAAWLSKGDTERALVDYSAAISLDRTSIAAYHRRGLLWLRRGEVERALADLDQAIRMSFTDPLIYRDRGMIWYEKGRFDRALADFDRAVKLAPDFAHPYFLRGLAYQRKGDPIRATANFEQAVRLDPSFANAVRQ